MKRYTADEWTEARAHMHTLDDVSMEEEDDEDDEEMKIKPLRLFIAGDKTQVGKTSVCLGLIGSLLRLGYQPSEICYIKPATQCELPQFLTRFCKAKGIENIPIGPLVFYSGFTREFLKGNMGTSDSIIKDIIKTVDDLCKPSIAKEEEEERAAKEQQQGNGENGKKRKRGKKIRKKICIIDGVGYPAVGSIVGVSNAHVARALKSPVMLVGPKGVGNAVDSFNLNSNFFESYGVPVLGAVFNRFETTGYYSLENCKSEISSYFSQFKTQYTPFGFLPELKELQELSAASSPNDWREEDERVADLLISSFANHVNIEDLLSKLQEKFNVYNDLTNAASISAPARESIMVVSSNSAKSPDTVVSNTSSSLAFAPVAKKSRAEIVASAKSQGASGG